MKDEPVLPIIETFEQAKAIGIALHQVRHFDAAWAWKVFNGGVKGSTRGSVTLNTELFSMWHDFMDDDERRRLVTAYVAERLKS